MRTLTVTFNDASTISVTWTPSGSQTLIDYCSEVYQEGGWLIGKKFYAYSFMKTVEDVTP